MQAVELLRAALEELSPAGYPQCDDRILVSLDDARRKIYPAVGRTPEQHLEVTLACQEAQKELVKTLLNKELGEEESYFYLAVLGKTIPFEQLQNLLEQTIARLEGIKVQAAE